MVSQYLSEHDPALLLTLGFRGPHRGDALMVALAGVGNGIAQFWWTRSLSLAPPSAVVPFNYLSLVRATILGFAVWGCRPRACWSVPRSLLPRAFTSCGARPYAADARRSQRRGARSPA